MLTKVRNISEIDLCDEYKTLLNGIGKYTGKPVKLNQSVNPVAKRHLRTLFHLRPKVETENNKHLQQRIRSESDIRDVPGAKNLSTILLFTGKHKLSMHDQAFKSTFKALVVDEWTLNHSKCEFNKQKILVGLVLSAFKGVSPDSAKFRPIRETTRPQNGKELRSFLGFTS